MASGSISITPSTVTRYSARSLAVYHRPGRFHEWTEGHEMGRPSIVEPTPTPIRDEELTARLFRALGDATRLSIVEFLLDEGPQPQKVIVEQVGLSQGQVSQHLTCLVWCGFLASAKRGRETHYDIASPRVAALIDLGRGFLSSTTGDIATCRINR